MVSKQSGVANLSARAMTALIALACVALVCTGCETARSVGPLPPLHISGVTKIPGIEGIETRSGVLEISSMAVYQSARGAESAVFSVGAALYSVGTDGSDLRQIGSDCGDFQSVLIPQHLLLCQQSGEPVILQLAGAHLGQLSTPIVLGTRSDLRGPPIWSPDGRYIAAVTRDGGGCSIGIFGVQSQFAQMSLVVVLALSDFARTTPGGIGCAIGGLGWSPDGNWLSFVQTDPPGAAFVLSLRDTVGTLLDSNTLGAPITVPISRAALIAVGATALRSIPVWFPTGATLTYVNVVQRSIEEFDPTTGRHSTLITQHVAGFFWLSWTADGRQLVFVLGLDVTEGRPPPSQLYVYTPATK